MANELKFMSYNCRGLGNFDKRSAIFHWIKHTHKPDILFMQETRTPPDQTNWWATQLGMKTYWGHFADKPICGGIAIAFKPNLNGKVYKYVADKRSRFLILDCQIEDKRCTLANIHILHSEIREPNDVREIFEEIAAIGNESIIIGGDFNIALQKKDGRSMRRNHRNNIDRDLIHAYMNEWLLADIWREQHPETNMFTFRIKNKGAINFFRLDYFLISDDLRNLITNSKIGIAFKSDHSPIMINPMLSENEKGRGLWRFNNSLLSDPTYPIKVRQEI